MVLKGVHICEKCRKKFAHSHRFRYVCEACSKRGKVVDEHHNLGRKYNLFKLVV